MFWAAKKSSQERLRHGNTRNIRSIWNTRDFRKIDFLFCEMFFLRISKAEPQRHFVLDLECQTGISSFCIFNMLKKNYNGLFFTYFFYYFFRIRKPPAVRRRLKFLCIRFFSRWEKVLAAMIPRAMLACAKPRKGWQATTKSECSTS